MAATQPIEVKGMSDGMSARDENGKNGGGDENLVAEYVLGVLNAEDHAAMARRIASDPKLQTEVEFWQQSFSSFDQEFEEIPAPAHTLGKIEERLFGANTSKGPIASLWQSLALWRGLAAGAATIAAVVIGVFVMQPNTAPTIDGTTQLVATLEAEDTDVKFVALYDSAKGSVRLSALSGQKFEDKDYELWFIDGDNAAVSMGIIPVDGKIEVPLTPDMLATITDGTVLAVTLEPLGGAPGGKATGPIVALGSVTTV